MGSGRRGNTISICKRELRAYFGTPIGYVLAIGSALIFALGLYPSRPGLLAGQLFALTGFLPAADLLREPRVVSLVGFARTLTMFLVPMIAMRLFVEEKRSRTIEMLFTSPVKDREMILGKWLSAMFFYVAILGTSVVEFAVFRWPDLDWRTLLAAQLALISQGAGLLAIGEGISIFAKREMWAAVGTFPICMLVVRYSSSGVLQARDIVVCVVCVVAGWLLTWRGIQSCRDAISSS